MIYAKYINRKKISIFSRKGNYSQEFLKRIAFSEGYMPVIERKNINNSKEFIYVVINNKIVKVWI